MSVIIARIIVGSNVVINTLSAARSSFLATNPVIKYHPKNGKMKLTIYIHTATCPVSWTPNVPTLA